MSADVAALGRRVRAGAIVASRDAARQAAHRVGRGQGTVGRTPSVRDDAIAAGIAWLNRSHDATGRRGSSKGFSLLHGWLPAYPETTGYVLEALIWQAERTGDDALMQRALQMADWEVEVQEPDGGIMEGHVDTVPRRSIVFNTGMVLHGWVTLLERGHTSYAGAAERAARFLTEGMRANGTWSGAFEYAGMPHTYNARVAWAMLRFAAVADDRATRDAAVRQLDWVLDRQRPNGWFDDCVFKPGMTPSTHAIAYTLRGLLESYALLGKTSWLHAAQRTSSALIDNLDALGWLPGAFDSAWRPTAGYACLTGTAQLGGVWLRLAELDEDDRVRQAGLRAIELAACRQERLALPDIDGALAGSSPVWGRYAPLQYPNWATRFLVESLMLREAAIA